MDLQIEGLETEMSLAKLIESFQKTLIEDYDVESDQSLISEESISRNMHEISVFLNKGTDLEKLNQVLKRIAIKSIFYQDKQILSIVKHMQETNFSTLFSLNINASAPQNRRSQRIILQINQLLQTIYPEEIS